MLNSKINLVVISSEARNLLSRTSMIELTTENYNCESVRIQEISRFARKDKPLV